MLNHRFYQNTKYSDFHLKKILIMFSSLRTRKNIVITLYSGTTADITVLEQDIYRKILSLLTKDKKLCQILYTKPLSFSQSHSCLPDQTCVVINVNYYTIKLVNFNFIFS